MKKKTWIVIGAVAALLAVLFVPIPTGVYKDGGTREYTALTYKIVDWNRLTDDGIYEETKIYFFPYNLRSIDALWNREEQKIQHKFLATVRDIKGTVALVEPVEGELERQSCDRITFKTDALKAIGAEVGSVVEITYTGHMRETYPVSIDVVDWEISYDLRHLEFAEQWLDQAAAEKQENNIFSDVVITKIYKNCFFARTVIPMPYEIKLNGTLSRDWCVGDQVKVTYENVFYDRENNRIEAELRQVEASDFELDPNACYKPVIYLYPEEKTDVSVKLWLNGRLTCTYPAYGDGWAVTAFPDGTLTDPRGQTYNYLYWEGETDTQYDLSKGFCVRGEDTALFLEDALARLGLNRREANEFIVYWLPLMQNNPYNIISFQTDAYTDAAKLEVTPAPDTCIRVFMAWQASDSYKELEPQQLTAPQRNGFTVVEWGGTELK